MIIGQLVLIFLDFLIYIYWSKRHCNKNSMCDSGRLENAYVRVNDNCF